MTWYLKTSDEAGAQYLRLTYDGAAATMCGELINSRNEGPFCYAAAWSTQKRAEKQWLKHVEQFPNLRVVKER